MILPRRVHWDDIDIIRYWYELRNIPLPERLPLPPMGLIVDDTAACFLYLTDGGIALIEGLITNPKAPLFKRYSACNDIIKRLANLAIAKGYKKILGLTQDAGTMKRVQRLGFRDLGLFHLVTLEAHN